MSDDPQSAPPAYTHEPLSGPEIFDIRTRWTARNAKPASNYHDLRHLFDEAQYDIARLLRHLDAFTGPPEIGS